MVHQYQITGMTCKSCESKVKTKLLSVPSITSVDVSKETNTATITMTKHIKITELQNALNGNEDKYHISEMDTSEHSSNWFETYKPIVLIVTYISFTTLCIQYKNQHFDGMQLMQHFMAGFFLVFSFFKLLNLKGFAESYIMYDVLAKRIPIWAYLYVFVELGLGIAYLVNWNPFLTNLTTVLVMSISIVGVLQSVLNKRKIQCACLGAVFNLPMSTVTIIEDGLMIIMSLTMLFFKY